LLQERWVLPLICVLLKAPAGAIGFNELGRQVGAHPPILASRLELLEQHGIVTKQVISQMPPRTLYRLSSAGLALRPVFTAIENWAMTAYNGLPESEPEPEPEQKTQHPRKAPIAKPPQNP
jgi:DNA-binding HxlR family transcriptional regulator